MNEKNIKATNCKLKCKVEVKKYICKVEAKRKLISFCHIKLLLWQLKEQ